MAIHDHLGQTIAFDKHLKLYSSFHHLEIRNLYRKSPLFLNFQIKN